MRRAAKLGKAEVGAGAGLYLTAEEAAKVLGVAVASLYAYVSRKGIRSQAVAGTRARLYWREDIDRIAQGPSAERAIKWDSILVPETKITLLTEQGHYYRGQSAISLSETATLEDVAALLWAQARTTLFPATALQPPEGFAEARAALARLAPTDQAIGLLGEYKKLPADQVRRRVRADGRGGRPLAGDDHGWGGRNLSGPHPSRSRARLHGP